jgi:hypothetical protein
MGRVKVSAPFPEAFFQLGLKGIQLDLLFGRKLLTNLRKALFHEGVQGLAVAVKLFACHRVTPVHDGRHPFLLGPGEIQPALEPFQDESLALLGTAGAERQPVFDYHTGADDADHNSQNQDNRQGGDHFPAFHKLT